MRQLSLWSPRFASRLLAGIALVALLQGCNSLKGPVLTMTADRTTISAGGFEHAVITVVAKNQGKPAVGVSVEFETELGSFSSSLDMTSTSIATDAEE